MGDCSAEEMTTAVDGLVRDLLAAANCHEPPVDVIRLAQVHWGITVCLDRRLPGRGRAQRAGGGRQIYLRPEPREERHQWTVAHEVGEHHREKLLALAGFVPAEIGPMRGESLANLFARRLLVPTAWFAEDARKLGFDILQLKKRYRTASHEILAMRMLDLPDPCIITILDNNHVTRRSSNAWPVNRTLHDVERQCQHYANFYSRPRTMQESGWTVQAWPIHQPDWKREIMRSVLEE